MLRREFLRSGLVAASAPVALSSLAAAPAPLSGRVPIPRYAYAGGDTPLYRADSKPLLTRVYETPYGPVMVRAWRPGYMTHPIVWDGYWVLVRGEDGYVEMFRSARDGLHIPGLEGSTPAFRHMSYAPGATRHDLPMIDEFEVALVRRVP